MNKKGFIIKLRQSRSFKGLSLSIVLSILVDVIHPTMALALTEGNSQTEVQSFEPISTTQMVDPFTGDFNYNIPLFNLPGPNGGYPVNLAYHAGVTMDDEASWVGLGWNINVGSINRNMRGLPDEFLSEDKDKDGEADQDSDHLLTYDDMMASWTLGVKGAYDPEFNGINLLKGLKDHLSLGASIYYNNFNGVGISVDPSLNYGRVSLDIGLDSESGMSISPSFSLGDKNDENKRKHKLGFTLDGDLSFNYSTHKNKKDKENDMYKGKYRTMRNDVIQKNIGVGSTFSKNNYIPSFSKNVDKYNLSLTVKVGSFNENFDFSSHYNLSAFLNTENYDNLDIEGNRRMVMGYAQAGGKIANNYTLDFMRQNDGQVDKGTKILPSSYYTYDTYSSTGQGLSSYFRTYRSDIGRTFDPYLENYTLGGGYGFETGNDFKTTIAFTKTEIEHGYDINANFGWDTKGSWDKYNSLTFDFNNPTPGGRVENVYYKVHGEQSLSKKNEYDYIKNFDLPLVKFDEDPNDGLLLRRSISGNGNNGQYKNQRTNANERVVRNTLVHTLVNSEVDKLGEFNVNYFINPTEVYSNIIASKKLYRKVRSNVKIDKHSAGYKVLNEEGSYYVYALPAYNHKEVEHSYSVNAEKNPQSVETVMYPSSEDNLDYKVGEKFRSKTIKSPYTHSYLLTSVQGSDYVDLKNDGPSDDDLGYWVKFKYMQYTQNDGNQKLYKWRTPYDKNLFNMGNSWTGKDDKASYQYGEKEIWYVGQIETKSHIAIFKMSERSDSKESKGEYGEGTIELSGMKVDEINIYNKKDFILHSNQATPLQTVHFEYENATNSLCHLAPNATEGKLTLKKVWFTSNGSTRGSQNAYEFDYGQSYSNPNYKMNSYDMWGSYKKKGSNIEHNTHFPYVNQFNQNWNSDVWEPNYLANEFEDDKVRKITQQTNDALVSAWCLKRITLPSGGEINIQYESDDYGYVQHKTANQMFKIERLGRPDSPNQIYDEDESNNKYYDDDPNEVKDEKERRIYFKLEYPIEVTSNIDVTNKEVYDKYVEPLMHEKDGPRHIYFKTKINLVDQVDDFISGYLPLEEGYKYNINANNNSISKVAYFVGCDENSIQNQNNTSYYTKGYVTIQAAKKKNGSYFSSFHPLAIEGWNYLQTQAPLLLNNGEGLNLNGGLNNQNPSHNDLLNKMPNIMSLAKSTAEMFGNIRTYCRNRGFASTIDLNNSVIRLASPDKKKFGGGHRVKQITITDNWNLVTNEKSRTYGQMYDYTMVEDGKIISSGVAINEPQAGGDENALKYPIKYFHKSSLFTNLGMNTEGPVNEHLFPGAGVGYRKVTITSLNTKDQIQKREKNITRTGRTGGVTVHEFFTAKDFPTLVDYSQLSEENDTKDYFNVPILVPTIGTLSRQFYHGTQAFKIELNDMHGKLRSTKTFQLIDGKMDENPITTELYEYKSHVSEYQGEQINILDSEVSVIEQDATTPHKISNEKRLMGVEVEIYTDQKEVKTFNNSGSFEVGFDGTLVYSNPPSLPILMFFPQYWATYSNHKTLFRTYVTNKVIHRTGILYKTTIRDLQTSNSSEIVAYDEKSGTPILSKTTNEFGDEMYSYIIPAYYQYERMGHAYQNINYKFNTLIKGQSDIQPSNHIHNPKLFLFSPTQEQKEMLVKGDELLTNNVVGGKTDYKNYFYINWFKDRNFKVSSNCSSDNINYSVEVKEANFIPYTRSGIKYGIKCTSINDEILTIEVGLDDSQTFKINGVVKAFYDVNCISKFGYYIKPMAVNAEQTYKISSNNYQKCYFLGWKYDSNNNITEGVLSFVNALDNPDKNNVFLTDLTVIRSGYRNHYKATAANYEFKGNFDDIVFEPYSLTSSDPLVTTNTVLNYKTPSNKLLSGNASLYSDDWSANFTSLNYAENSITFNSFLDGIQGVEGEINPFLSGNSGIFRPFKSYTYVGKRFAGSEQDAYISNNATSNPKLREFGVFDHKVPMFTWDLGNLEDYESNWEWVNEVTRFSGDSYETENVNRLNIKSSALYGYNNSLSIAVGSNASFHELGVEDFESIVEESDGGWDTDNRIKQNHFNFYRKSGDNQVVLSEILPIKKGEYIKTDNPSLDVEGYIKFRSYNVSDYIKNALNFINGFTGDKDYINEILNQRTTVALSIVADKTSVAGNLSNRSYFLNGSFWWSSYGQNNMNIYFRPYVHCLKENNFSLPLGTRVSGKATIYEKRFKINSTEYLTNVSLSKSKAHTGKQSMKITSNVVFDQPMLRLIKGKEYVVSMWVSTDNSKVKTFKNDLKDLVIPGSCNSVGNFDKFDEYDITYGKVIEGWQKIDLEFKTNDSQTILALQFNPQRYNLYIDDIRFSPKTGGISTYVYDPVKFQLRATLNVDNYATFYYYDEQGKLAIKKQETEKGVFTITESRGNNAKKTLNNSGSSSAFQDLPSDIVNFFKDLFDFE